MMALSDRIRQVRRHATLSQSGLARIVGVARSAVAQWEGKTGSRPTVEHLLQIAAFAAVNFEWLATGRGPKWPKESSQEPAALQLDYFAQDELEERLLRGFRKIGHFERAPFVEFIEMVGMRD